MYGLSQRAFSKLLNWGDKTIPRYENGSIQDKAHNSILMFLKEPLNMKTYLKENETSLNEKQLLKLDKILENLINDTREEKTIQFLNSYFYTQPNIENGFKSFDYLKFAAMIIFFSNKDNELLKTKLMKLLNYSDMIYFKNNSLSISGTRYLHLPYGPVPEKFDILLERLQEDKIIKINIEYNGMYEKIK